MKGKTHLHAYFQKHTYVNQKKNEREEKTYYEDLRCIQIYKSSEKGQNANEDADTTCQKSMCVHTGCVLECTVHMLQAGSC